MSLANFHGIGELWRETLGDSRICIAVIDGPVDLSHPCFHGAELTQLEKVAVDKEAGPTAPHGTSAATHGTLVASIIFGQPGSPIDGVAPRCRGLLIPVYSERRRRVSQLALSAAICKAVEHGAHLINISGGQLTYSGEADDLLAHAIEAAHKKNVVIVAAAGNDRDPRQNRNECLHVPAALPTVLTAGAMDENGHPLECSCWGPAYQAQGVLALGKDVLGAMPGGGARRWTGTSLAAPVVTGVAALLLSLQLGHRSRIDPHTVRSAILAGAQPCDPTEIDDCTPYMAGRLDGVGAMKILSKEGKMSEHSETTVVPQGERIAVSAAEVSQASAVPPPSSAPAPSVPRVAAQSSDGLPPPPPPGAGYAMPPGPAVSAPGIAPSACACEEAKGLVFFIGLVGYDFGTEARRDTFKQQMPPVLFRQVEGRDEFRYEEGLSDDARQALFSQGFQEFPPNPFDTRQMVAYLRYRPEEARALIWTLNLELTPVYCVEPVGAFASSVYEVLVNMMDGQSRSDGDRAYVERVSVPAVLTGQTVRLFSGQEVTEILVDAPRGMYSWKTTDLIERSRSIIEGAIKKATQWRLQGAPPPPTPEDLIRQILNKLYYEYRNLGVTSPDRAMNFAATNVFSLMEALATALGEGKSLDRIDVVKSPYCRVDSDCWDIMLKFIDPDNTNRAYTVLRYSIDVSDKLPVTLGKVVNYTSST